MNGQFFVVNSEHSLKCAQNYLLKQWNEKKWLEMRLNFDKTRSIPQNSSLHKYCQQLADALNDAGHHFVITINGVETDCNWNMERVKDFLWRPIQQAITKEKSTTRISTKETTIIYETLNRHTTSKLGVYVPWPCKENMGGRGE